MITKAKKTKATGGAAQARHYDAIVRPVITEKSTAASDHRNATSVNSLSCVDCCPWMTSPAAKCPPATKATTLAVTIVI